MVMDQVGDVHEAQCAVQHDGGDALGQRLDPRRGVLPSLPPACGEAAQQAGRPAVTTVGGGSRALSGRRTRPTLSVTSRDASTATAPSPSTTSPARSGVAAGGRWLASVSPWSMPSTRLLLSRARADPAPVSWSSMLATSVLRPSTR